MQANPEKFQFLLMKPSNSKESFQDHISISNIDIIRNENVNFLGITIDDKLKFDVHVMNICI